MAKDKKEKSGFMLFITTMLKTFIVIIVLIILGGGAFLGYKYFKENSSTKKKAVTVEVLDNLDEYGYKLSDNDTELYKEEFQNLKDIVNSSPINEEEYAKQVAKMFIIQLYTMTNRTNKYDIDASDFFYSDQITMFEQKVMDTLYLTLIDNTYGDRTQELPEVKSIEVTEITPTTYKLGDQTVDAYQVKLTWEYVSDLGYDDEGTVILCKNGDTKWSVVDFQPTLNPKYE